MCRYITIETIESDIPWNHDLKICHEIDQSHIIVWNISSRSPYSLKLRVWCHNRRVDLDLIRTKITIIPNTSKTLPIHLWCTSWKILHHMCNNFDTCIFEKLCCLDRFTISMTSFREFINLIKCCLITKFHSCYTISS